MVDFCHHSFHVQSSVCVRLLPKNIVTPVKEVMRLSGVITANILFLVLHTGILLKCKSSLKRAIMCPWRLVWLVAYVCFWIICYPNRSSFSLRRSGLDSRLIRRRSPDLKRYVRWSSNTGGVADTFRPDGTAVMCPMPSEVQQTWPVNHCIDPSGLLTSCWSLCSSVQPL